MNDWGWIESLFLFFKQGNSLPFYKFTKRSMILIDSKAYPSFLQFFFKVFQKYNLISTCKYSLSLFSSKLDDSINWHPIMINDPWTDDKEGPSSSSMTMNTDFPFIHH